jgi:hypothetical protein
MNHRQRSALWPTIALLIVMALVPPWTRTTDFAVGSVHERSERSAGYAVLFAPPEPSPSPSKVHRPKHLALAGEGVVIDFPRLLIQCVIVVLIGGGLIVTLKEGGAPPATSEPMDAIPARALLSRPPKPTHPQEGSRRWWQFRWRDNPPFEISGAALAVLLLLTVAMCRGALFRGPTWTNPETTGSLLVALFGSFCGLFGLSVPFSYIAWRAKGRSAPVATAGFCVAAVTVFVLSEVGQVRMAKAQEQVQRVRQETFPQQPRWMQGQPVTQAPQTAGPRSRFGGQVISGDQPWLKDVQVTPQQTDVAPESHVPVDPWEAAGFKPVSQPPRPR